MTINSRILQLVNIKAAGNKTRFAEMLGYSPQHLQGMLKGSVGLSVVERILDTFPDVDARWLVTGSGDSPIMPGTEVRKEVFERIGQLIKLDTYLPYMTADEIESYRSALRSGSEIHFNAKQLYDWEQAKTKSNKNARR